MALVKVKNLRDIRRRRYEVAAEAYRIAARWYGQQSTDLRSDAKTAVVCAARYAAWVAVRMVYGWSYPVLGDAFDKDHTTIINGARRAEHIATKHVAKQLAEWRKQSGGTNVHAGP